MHILSSLLIFALLGTFIIAEEFSNDLENERVKRVVVNDIDFDNNSPRQMSRPKSKAKASRTKDAASNTRKSGPAIVLPPYHDGATFDKAKSCMLYLEGITILALNTKTIGAVQQAFTLPLWAYNGTYGWEEGYVKCQSNYTSLEHFYFTIDYQMDHIAEFRAGNDVVMTVDATKGFQLTLDFVFNSGFNLAAATISGLKVTTKGQDTWPAKDVEISDTTNSSSSAFRAYYGYNYACSATPALLFRNPDNSTDVRFGVILNNFQVQGFGISRDTDTGTPYFGSRTADCMPTFNQGSWMGIVVTLVLVSVLAFAFLMLNSVQTMDRFDDPKQKQIVINFKE